MIYSIAHVILAALGLGFLIFIHELGHYFMARREGMAVEAFSIGFGKPLFSWERDGVRWQVCMLPFGGYVRIAGMEKKGSLEPYQIPNGFYGKKPWARIKVALMGPIVNIVFALLAFTFLWMSGGREKPFSEYTTLIGSVEPCSDLSLAGVRPGDQITELNGKPFQGFEDLIYASLLDGKDAQIKGWKIDYPTREKKPFDYTLEMDQDLKGFDRTTMTIGVLSPASYLIYSRAPGGKENPLPKGSPMADSGIAYDDRIVWVDGQLIFSKKQLISTINEPKVLLTLQRGDEEFQTRVPRLKVADLRISSEQKAELDDWMHAANLKLKLPELFFIPYNINAKNVVEEPLTYIDEESKEQKPCPAKEGSVQAGDRILAVDGISVGSPVELLSKIQVRHAQIIVAHQDKQPVRSWKEADDRFDDEISWEDLQAISSSIGTDHHVTERGTLRLLKPVVPKTLSEFPLSEETKTRLADELLSQRKKIEEIQDPQEKERALGILEDNQKKLMLGIVLQDRLVMYNPSPLKLFFGVFEQTWRTLVATLTGYLSPKWLSGPVGIVQVMHHGWSIGVKEALFWMAMISLNLGIINLLPIPVLDGGHICFALFEKITGRPIKAKTMERLIIPFIVLVIAFFIYVTYHDVLRLLGRFF